MASSNGIAIGYGQRDSGVRYMPVSPGVGLAQGQASIGASLKEASKAFLHSSAAVAELELNAQRDQLDRLGTDLALQAERDYSMMVYGDPSVPGSGFVNRMDAENFVPEFERRFSKFREGALQGVPAPLRDRVDEHLQKIRTRQFVELKGLSARQSREGLVRSRSAYAELLAGQGDMDGMEEAVRSIPGLSPEEQELKISRHRGEYEKTVTVQSQAANHADRYHRVTNDPDEAAQFLLEMQDEAAWNEALTTYGGEAKVKELQTAARAQIDADGHAGIYEYKTTGKKDGLANAAMGGAYTERELAVLEAAGSSQAVPLRKESMELDIAAAPVCPADSAAMREYLAEREGVWKELGASDTEISRAREAVKSQAEMTHGRVKVDDLLTSVEAARPHYYMTKGNEYANGLKYHERSRLKETKWQIADEERSRAAAFYGRDSIDDEDVRVFLMDEQERLMREEKARVDARVAGQFNDWLCTQEGKEATIMAQKDKFVELLNKATNQSMSYEEVFGSRNEGFFNKRVEAQENARKMIGEKKSEGGWRVALPSVERTVLTPGVFVPEGVAAGPDSVVVMVLPDGKAVQLPVLGSSGGEQFVVSGGASLRMKGFSGLRREGVRYRVRERSGFQFDRNVQRRESNAFMDVLGPAELIYRAEAHESHGKLRVYNPPAGDGGGKYEVAGINERFHPAEAAKLKGLIAAGNHDEAKAEAIRYIEKLTRPVKQALGSLHAPGAEAVMRDMHFNSPAGAQSCLNKVLGLRGSGGYATKRAALEQYIRRHGEAAFIEAFSAARADFYDHVAATMPEKRQFLKGWHNRVRNSQKDALALMNK